MGVRQSVKVEDLYADYRPLLFAITYRMVGTVTDAEDLVQDVFLQTRDTDWSQILDIKAYLCKVATHRAMDFLKSTRRQRETYVGPWLPEPLLTSDEDADPAWPVLRYETLSYAFLTLLNQLTPVERAVFLLREAFQYDYQDIASILDKSEPNCRKVMSRVKAKLRGIEPVTFHDPHRTHTYVQTFMEASSSGNLHEFVQLLADDVVLYSDGGGVVRSATKPVTTRDKVAAFILGLYVKTARLGLPSHASLVSVNHEDALAVFSGGKLSSIVAFQIQNGLIHSIYMVRNPDKLRRIAGALGVSVLTEV